MFDQSTLLPPRRVCVLLGGSGSPAPFVAPKLAALLQEKPPAFGLGAAVDSVAVAGQPA